MQPGVLPDEPAHRASQQHDRRNGRDPRPDHRTAQRDGGTHGQRKLARESPCKPEFTLLKGRIEQILRHAFPIRGRQGSARVSVQQFGLGVAELLVEGGILHPPALQHFPLGFRQLVQQIGVQFVSIQCVQNLSDITRRGDTRIQFFANPQSAVAQGVQGNAQLARQRRALPV